MHPSCIQTAWSVRKGQIPSSTTPPVRRLWAGTEGSAPKGLGCSMKHPKPRYPALISQRVLGKKTQLRNKPLCRLHQRNSLERSGLPSGGVLPRCCPSKAKPSQTRSTKSNPVKPSHPGAPGKSRSTGQTWSTQSNPVISVKPHDAVACEVSNRPGQTLLPRSTIESATLPVSQT